MPVKATEAEVLSYFDKLSNWGRWGDDDELGAINLITPEKRKQALTTVAEGVTVTCARPIGKNLAAPGVQQAYMHFMSNSGERWRDVKQAEGVFQFSTDFIGFNFHGHSITHIDALSHIFWNGMSYNGFSAAKCTTNLGALVDSIAVLREGVTTRGVLLDIPRLKGVKWLEKEPGIFPEELDAAAAAAQRACRARRPPLRTHGEFTGSTWRRVSRPPSRTAAASRPPASPGSASATSPSSAAMSPRTSCPAATPA